MVIQVHFSQEVAVELIKFTWPSLGRVVQRRAAILALEALRSTIRIGKGS